MSDTEARGIAGDRRRNPFPSLNDTEYELFLMTIEHVVTSAVSKAMEAYRVNNCVGHIERTECLEAKAVEIDRRLLSVEATVAQLRRVTWTAVAALIIGSVGIVLALINSPAIGQ